MNRLCGVLCGWVAVVSVADFAGGAELLRYKMSEDERAYYRTETSVDLKQTIDGVESSSKFVVEEIVETSLLGVVDQNLRIQSTVKKLRVDVSHATLGKYVFDSEASGNDKDTPLGEALTPLYEGMSTLLLVKTFTNRGGVISIKGYDGLVIGALKTNPITSQFAVGANEQSAKVSFADEYVEFPKKEVAPGDTWEVPMLVTFGEFGEVKGKRTYKYVEKSAVEIKNGDTVGKLDLVKIDVGTEFQFDVNVNKNGLMVTGTVVVKDATGQALFDPKRGCVHSRRQKLTLEGDFKISANNETRTLKQTQIQQVNVDRLAEYP